MSLTKNSILFDNALSLSIKELTTEAKLLFDALDSTSSVIRDLEKNLGETKAHFPFKYFVLKEVIPNVHENVNEHEINASPWLHAGQCYLRRVVFSVA